MGFPSPPVGNYGIAPGPAQVGFLLNMKFRTMWGN